MNTKIFVFLAAYLVALKTAFAQNSCNLSEARNRFDSLPYEEKEVLRKSCQETYTQGVGWANSATGCGRCPKSASYYSYMSPANAAQMQKMDAVVAAGTAAQQAVLQFGQNWAAEKNNEANERVANIRIEASERFVSIEKKYVKTTLSEPTTGIINGRDIGEKILELTTGYFADCMVPHFDSAEDAMGGWVYSIKKEIPICKEEEKKNRWYSTYYNEISKNNRPPFLMPFKLTENKKGITVCQTAMGMSAGCVKNKAKTDFSFINGFVSDVRLPNKYLIYAGRSSSILRFNFVESNVVRDIEFDISQSASVSCSGSKIDILEADEKSLTYTVASGFDDLSHESLDCGREVQGGFSEETPSPQRPEERLLALKRLLDGGLISAAEYEKKKSEIVSEL